MHKKSLVFASLLAVLILLVTPLLLQTAIPGASQAAAQKNAGGPGLALQMPPFFSAAKGANLYQSTIADYFAGGVAGIAAYTNVGKDINVDKLAESGVFQTVEDSAPGEYVIGSVVTSGFKDSTTVAELMQVHVFAQREGWIVSYLTPEQPTAQIIDWSKFPDSKFDTTTLYDVMQQVAKAAGVTIGEVGYYHFSYPDAMNLIFVGDTLAVGNPELDSFTIKIPPAISLSEASVSHSTFGYLWNTSCSLNGREISKLRADEHGYWFLDIKQIDASEWKTDSPNNVDLWSSSTLEGVKRTNCGIALVYGVAE